MNTERFTFSCRTKTGFGLNALEHLPFDLTSMGSRKPLVLLDKDAGLAGLSTPLIRAFKETDITLGICPPLHGPSGKQSRPKESEQLKEFYRIYRDKGFDAVIALGTGALADMAKALNLCATLGPDALKHPKESITSPLNPWIHIPTGLGKGTETTGIARFGGQVFDHPFLAPDLAVITPDMLIPETRETLVDTGLACLAVCCEVHVLSHNPPARAYAATAIRLIMKDLPPLIEDALSPGKTEKKEIKKAQSNLVQVSVITGYLLDNFKRLITPDLSRAVLNASKKADPDSALTRGEAMALVLPAVLERFSQRDKSLGELLLPLAGAKAFSSTPQAQHPGLGVQVLRSFLNDLYCLSHGAIPRTLHDAGLDMETVEGEIQAMDTGIDPRQAKTVLAHSFDGSPAHRM